MSVLNPTTYLDLVQRSAMECQISPGDPSTLIDTVVNQTGQAFEFCAWVNESWKEIQSKYPDMGFMLVSPGVSFATVAGQQMYTPTQAGIASGVVGQWKRDTFRCYHTSTGTPSEVHMHYVEWDEWRDNYLFGALRTAQVQPIVFTIAPNLDLGIQTPLAGYTITGDYFRAPTTLAADADTVDIPAQYIMAIVYRTMMFYGASESAPEVYNTGQQEFNKLMGRLALTRLPEVRGPGALA